MKRSNGAFALRWRELGQTRTTTKTTAAAALAWAEQKAADLDAGDVRQWVSRGEGESLEALRKMAGPEDGALRRLVEDVREARRWLAGKADLTAAARYYAEHGMLQVESVTLAASVARFLAEYDSGSAETRRTFGQELEAFLTSKGGGIQLVELTVDMLDAWVSRPVSGRPPAARTHRNRITTWVTFLNRCRVWKLLPKGDHAGDSLRKPKIPDAGKEIFSVEQGKALLLAVRKHEPKLEGYLLIAGWLGLRPSEIQRLTWEEEGGLEKGGFDWDRGYLHVSVRVAQKNSSERFIPMDPRLSERLREIFSASKRKKTARCCGFRSREFLSVLARKHGVCSDWPTDVLRHSFCSYRIAVTQSLDQVAVEADNSPSILKSNYRRPLRHEDGLAWWGLLDAEADPAPES